MALHANGDDVIYFGSFGVEHIPKEIRKFIGNRNITVSILKIQAYDSIMCGYFCTRFIDFILRVKSLLDYTNLFFPKKYE